MLALYIFTAIVGMGLLALGALGGEADGDAALGELDGDIDLDPGWDGSWKKAFSMRAIAYFMAGFGATGGLLTLLGTTGPLALLLALGMGIFASTLVVLLFGWVRATEGGFGTGSDAYVGALGRVRLPIRPPVPGTVDIEHQGRRLTMRARAMAGTGSDPAGWSRILVVDVDPTDGVLLVQPVDEFLAGEGESAPARTEP